MGQEISSCITVQAGTIKKVVPINVVSLYHERIGEMQTALIQLIAERPACSQEGCSNLAKYRYSWTGKDVFGCEGCTDWAMQVAEAITYTEPRRTLVRLVTPDELDLEKSSNEYE